MRHDRCPAHLGERLECCPPQKSLSQETGACYLASAAHLRQQHARRSRSQYVPPPRSAARGVSTPAEFAPDRTTTRSLNLIVRWIALGGVRACYSARQSSSWFPA